MEENTCSPPEDKPKRCQKPIRRIKFADVKDCEDTEELKPEENDNSCLKSDEESVEDSEESDQNVSESSLKIRNDNEVEEEEKEVEVVTITEVESNTNECNPQTIDNEESIQEDVIECQGRGEEEGAVVIEATPALTTDLDDEPDLKTNNEENSTEQVLRYETDEVGCSLKVDSSEVEPDITRNMTAKWEKLSEKSTETQNKKSCNYDEPEEFMPKVDTTKNLKQKFEDKQQETTAVATDVGPDACHVCRKKVYPMEKLEFSGLRVHKTCFRCVKCKCNLRLENFTRNGDKLYCITHYKQLFMEKGNYEQGFGLEQHKDKWKC